MVGNAHLLDGAMKRPGDALQRFALNLAIGDFGVERGKLPHQRLQFVHRFGEVVIDRGIFALPGGDEFGKRAFIAVFSDAFIERERALLSLGEEFFLEPIEVVTNGAMEIGSESDFRETVIVHGREDGGAKDSVALPFPASKPKTVQNGVIVIEAVSVISLDDFLERRHGSAPKMTN